jgi:hypothetical protein
MTFSTFLFYVFAAILVFFRVFGTRYLKGTYLI